MSNQRRSVSLRTNTATFRPQARLCRLRHLITILLIGCGTLLVQAQPSSTPGAGDGQNHIKFHALIDLQMRHPEIAAAEDFSRWLNGGGISVWHETRAENKARTVVAQSANGESFFAARVTMPDGDEMSPKLQRTAIVQATDSISRDQALAAIKAREELRETKIHAVRPVVDFSDAGVELSWEIELAESRTIRIFNVKKGPVIQEMPAVKIQALPRSEASPPVPPAADDMGSNELHHLDQFRAEAQSWTAGAATTQDRVRRIFQRVQSSYTYDGTIVNIAEFTWADNLVRDRNNRSGICDEWAVVQVSYLRALGIPARMKFLIWQKGTEGIGHAALEYADGGTWRHLDSLWHAFNNPAIYRQTGGATNVTVMDADYPLDSRSTVPAWGVPDPTGDGKLYPYGDFVIAPAYPGNARPGYSN
jgi:Transglutaminase-like superfamily